MLVLEKKSYNTEWFISKLYAASKEIVNARFRKDYAFDPLKGGNLLRFFKREILERAFAAIPEVIMPEIIHGDHDILYYEAYQISQNVGLLKGALWHVEPDFRKLWRTNLRYGASLRTLKKLIIGICF